MKKSYNKEWDENLDKIADENGGHYVVPFPEVDTSEVSKFIKEYRKKRELYGKDHIKGRSTESK